MIRAGQKLREERIKKGLTINDVSKGTKIKTSFLDAIEKGEYQKLPSSTYAQGFVKNYAQFLGLEETEILALFRREFDEEKIFKVLPEGLAKDDFPISRFKFHQTAKIIFFVFIVLLAYIFFQYKYAFINPPLTVSSPSEGEIISSQTITVSGKTDSNATVYINNDPTSLNSNGTFKKNINVFTGKTTITIKVVNSFGKEKTIDRHIEVKP